MEESILFLSPEEVAEKLDLNVRTIRRYIREGRLKATRIGKQYRIAANDFQVFVGADQTTRPNAPTARTRRVVVSATTDIHALSRSESDRVSAILSGAFNTTGVRSGAHLECIYYEEEETLRIVVNAGLEFTSVVLSLVNSVLSDDE
jgi:excisionase family DNA binding protein